MVKVNFNPLGFAILDVAVRPKNSPTMEIVKYKVDTGANCTTIGKKRLLELGYDENWIKSGKLLEGDK